VKSVIIPRLGRREICHGFETSFYGQLIHAGSGAAMFEYFNHAARRHPAKEIGFITWSNSKNDAGIGWPQAVQFYKAMQETRRPHLFVWGLSGRY
jgi:hypothetical protein